MQSPLQMQPPRAPALPPLHRRTLHRDLHTANHQPWYRSSRLGTLPATFHPPVSSSSSSSSSLHRRSYSINSTLGIDQQLPPRFRPVTLRLGSNSISSRCHLATPAQRQCLALSRSRQRGQAQSPRRSARVRVRVSTAHFSTRQSNNSNSSKMYMRQRRRRPVDSSSGLGPGPQGQRSGGCARRMTSSRNPRRSC